MTKLQLTRVCASCGIKKPLPAFLQLSSARGTSYGAICSECRRTVIKPKQPLVKKEDKAKDAEGHGSSSTGFRIGAKAKITAELEKRRQRQNLNDLYEKTSKKRTEIRGEKLSQLDIKQKLEKQHKTFIDNKKRGFLSDTAKKTSVSKHHVAQKARQRSGLPLLDKHAHEAEKREALAQHELKLTTIDLTLPFRDPQFSEIRHQSSVFLQFKQWLGSGAPMAKASVLKALERIYNNSQLNANNKTDKKHNKETQNVLREYVDKQFPHSSTRKR
jgi:hypothetical protein